MATTSVSAADKSTVNVLHNFLHWISVPRESPTMTIGRLKTLLSEETGIPSHVLSLAVNYGQTVMNQKHGVLEKEWLFLDDDTRLVGNLGQPVKDDKDDKSRLIMMYDRAAFSCSHKTASVHPHPPIVINQDAQKEKDCVVCFSDLTKTLPITFVPCGHTGTCKTCAAKLSVCPLCRAPIQQYLSIYL